MIGVTFHLDARPPGNEHLVYGDANQLSRVPDQLLDCVCFLCTRDASGAIRVGGTAFFVSVPAVEVPGAQFVYLVTAAHCITSANESGDTLGLRLNMRDGGTTFADVSQLGWTSPDSDGPDVAVSSPLPSDLSSRGLDYKSVPHAMFLTEEIITEKDIGVGDELLVTGLFFHRIGRERNHPIVRSGIIAAMPSEPLTDENSGLEYHAYLAEVRSIGGLSGSPVFVRLGPGRTAGGITNLGGPTYYLLGLIRGHWKRGLYHAADFGTSEFESMNTGIALVTPLTDALTVLESEAFVKHRKQEEREFQKQSTPTKDSLVTEDSEFERFEDLARKLVNTPKS
jgi:hypothetical protein